MVRLINDRQQQVRQQQQQEFEQQDSKLDFTCIGSKCHIFPPQNGLDLELAWSSAQTRVEEASSCLKDAITMIEEDSAIFGPRVLQSSQPKKKLFVQSLLHKLLSASNSIHQFQKFFGELRESSKSISDKLKATEKAHMETLNQLQTFTVGNTCDGRDGESGRVEMLRLEFPEDESLTGKTKESARDDSEFRYENTKLKEEIQDLLNDNRAKTIAVAAAERNSDLALAQAEKHKEVIARLTADNMIFLMKVKQTEESLQISLSKQEELQKQLEFCRSSWLEEASAEIEDAVKGSLDKAQACELELQKVRRQQESRMGEVENKLKQLTDDLNRLAAVKESLEERLKTVEDERIDLSRRLEKEASERHQLQVQNSALANNVERNNIEFGHLSQQYQQLIDEMKTKSAEFEARQEREACLLENLNSVTSQLETQQTMNSSLMKKKEEVEWMCLEAQAEREKLKQQLQGLVNASGR